MRTSWFWTACFLLGGLAIAYLDNDYNHVAGTLFAATGMLFSRALRASG